MSENQKPIVLLDVDGVINDLSAEVSGKDRKRRQGPTHTELVLLPYPDPMVPWFGWFSTPLYMPGLITMLAKQADIYWLTAWGENARHIEKQLGVGPFPVITGKLYSPLNAEWKGIASRPIAEEARLAGRRVFWIEDFNERVYPGTHSHIERIDTVGYHENGRRKRVLAEDDLPEVLRWL